MGVSTCGVIAWIKPATSCLVVIAIAHPIERVEQAREGDVTRALPSVAVVVEERVDVLESHHLTTHAERHASSYILSLNLSLSPGVNWRG